MRSLCCSIPVAAFAALLFLAPQIGHTQSVHRQQELQLLASPPPAHEKTDLVEESAGTGASDPKSATPTLSSDFINFGYIQNDVVLPHVRWHSLTHVGTAFVDFLSNASLQNPSAFTARDADLKLNGAAHNAGVKVIVVVRNDNFDETILTSVMQNAGNRTTLVNNIKNLIIADTYCQGVSFDFEFSWGSATRDGISLFLAEMRAALPAQYEISIYTHAIYSSSQWNVATMEPSINYMLYSTYDWASGLTPHAISDYNNCVGNWHDYMDAGLPAHKLVPVWASYARRWEDTTAYNSAGIDSVSQGFTDGLYDTTLEPQFGGPYANNYVTGDEGAWYTYNISGTNYTTTWDSTRSLETKIRASLSCPPSGSSPHNGKRLGGVGWWSLYWMANFTSSYDPIAAAASGRTRTYPHIYQLCTEALAPKGTTRFVFEGFENSNPRWADPNESPDEGGDTDNDSADALVNSPAGAGRPASTTKAMQLTFDFESASATNRLFYRHEVLNDNGDTAITDINATACHVEKSTAFIAPYYVAGNYSARTISMALLDGNRQIEVMNPTNLPSVAGWNTLVWDLTDPSSVRTPGYNTNEPAFLDGNGVINTAGNGAQDISFLGFIIEGGPAGSGNITFDELSYEHRTPGNKQYKINEFRYAVSGSEFVEIKGPVGPFPTGMVLRFYNGATGAVASSVNLAAFSIPASGLFVVGDTGVANTTGLNGTVPAGWGAADNIPNTDPGAIQLYDGNAVYDSVVFEAMGGLDDLTRTEARRVTGEGYGWIGEVGPGTNAAAAPYAVGRYPDGTDTNVNEADFSYMPATPGTSNGNSITLPVNYNFTTAPPTAFQTYQTISVANPTGAGLPASPGGGNVYRCVDTAGGGVVGVFGDMALGGPSGLDIQGRIYIPAAAHPAQAIAIGLCGTQGSTFFASTTDSSGYDNGYWLIYEHGTITLNDGQASHDGSFQFLWATNDNMDTTRTLALGTNKTRATLGISQNSWVPFRLTINPAAPTDKLVAQINSVDVYRGAIPSGGPTRGAVQVGFREAAAPIAATEGTWIDDLQINSVTSLVNEWSLY